MKWTALCALVAAAFCGMPAPSLPGTPQAANVIVHEWGTFLSLQGSDGVALGGMIESEEPLPAFVRERALSGCNRACLFQKMETPVTYFYTDKPTSVRVRVDMPQGILTHWYPAVRAFGPPPTPKANPSPAGSFLDWGRVELVPNADSSRGASRPLKPVRQDETWRFSRQTDSALVRIDSSNPRVRPEGEFEKFLFYRGVGGFELPLQVTSKAVAGDTLFAIRNRSDHDLHGIFVVCVEKNTIQFTALPEIAGGATLRTSLRSMFSARRSLDGGVEDAKNAVRAALVGAGLYAREAQAMVNTWEKSYFHNEGLRFLYLLPRATVDQTIPLHIEPQPRDLVRVMLGRVEVLTPQKEDRIEKALADVVAPLSDVRLQGKEELARLGRFLEPALRRVISRSVDPKLQARAQLAVQGVAK